MFLASKLSVFIALRNKVSMKHLHQTNQTLTIIILVYFYLFTFGFKYLTHFNFLIKSK